jgi:quercetin dioxygenase-like cupin family protein
METSVKISLKRWEGVESPSASEIEALFRNEGLRPSSWSNGPGDRYGEHQHSYHKVLYCVKGSIVFESRGKRTELRPGDRMEIPPGVPHSAVVGPEGTSCMEASR